MSSKEKTIVVLTPAFPADESEDFWVPSQQVLVKALKKKSPGVNIIVLAYFYPYKKTVYKWHGIRVIGFNGMKLNRLILFARMWKELKKIKKENNIVGLFSFWCREGAFIGKWFGKWNAVKHFCWICGQDARETNNYVKWISPRSKELIAISDFVASEFEKNHRIRPAYVIPNGIDADLFPPDLPPKRDIDVLFVGSLVQLKRPDIFVSVIKKLKRHIASVKAIICGHGDQEENLKTQIDRLELAANISLTGAIAHAEVLQLMQRSKILLHPSSYEGFSTVCLEALYAGAHVVSFTKAMNNDIRNWHIVKTEEEMFEKSLESLARSYEKYEKILVYSMNDTAKSVMDLFLIE